MQCSRIDRGIDVAHGQQSGQRRRKAEMARPFGVVQRLDAEPVARQHDAPGIALPDREGEHPVKTLNAAWSPFLVGFEDDFGVAPGEEPIAFGRKIAAQLAKIIDAAVEDDGKAQFRIDHRLLRRRREIDNAEPSMTERDATLRECAAGVRSARPHSRHHRGEQTAGRVNIKSHLTANPAHSITLSRAPCCPTGPQQRSRGESSSWRRFRRSE